MAPTGKLAAVPALAITSLLDNYPPTGHRWRSSPLPACCWYITMLPVTVRLARYRRHRDGADHVGTGVGDHDRTTRASHAVGTACAQIWY